MGMLERISCDNLDQWSRFLVLCSPENKTKNYKLSTWRIQIEINKEIKTTPVKATTDKLIRISVVIWQNTRNTENVFWKKIHKIVDDRIIIS